MNAHVIDSSAVLIVLKREPQMQVVLPLLPGALISSVNASECIAGLVRHGVDPRAAIATFDTAHLVIIPLDRALAERAGTLIVMTKRFGLSLGDRACLALAMREGLPVYTADRNWKDLNVGVEINLVR